MSVLSAEEVLEKLRKPERLYSYSDVIGRHSVVPKKAGIYGVYFKEIPPLVPTDGCVVKEGKTLLYVGKSNLGKTANLRERIRQHYKSKARSSTLRKSLGVLLYGKDPTPFRIVSEIEFDKYSLTPEYEKGLSAWMEKNVFIVWVEHESPSDVENDIIQFCCFPLNIKDNGGCTFSCELQDMRNIAEYSADILPTLKELKESK